MKLTTRNLIIGAAAICVTPFASAETPAQNRDNAWSFSVLGGAYTFDDDRAGDDATIGTIGAGYNFTEKFTTEFMLSMFSSENDEGGDLDGTQYRLDLLYHLNSGSPFTPYVIGGLGHQVIDTGNSDADETISNVGLGMKWFMSENFALRADARFVASQDYDYAESIFYAGINYIVGGTPPKPTDDDNDGVANDADKCAGTPVGIQVDAEGCTLDTDGDGVANQNDSCPDTSAGTLIDEKGCPIDTDNDGVKDLDDKCPNTPANAPVNVAGCPTDSDRDGVADYADKCADTPEGAKIDDNGCRVKLVEAVEMKMQIEFASGKSDLQSQHFAEIKKVADFMAQYPDAMLVIEGHTDSTGDRGYNVKLSQARADSVRARLVSFHNVSEDRVTAVGYGPDRPIADNRTREGRKQNRRVLAVVKGTSEK